MSAKPISLTVHRNTRRERLRKETVSALHSEVRALTRNPCFSAFILVGVTSEDGKRPRGTLAYWRDPEGVIAPGMLPETAYRAVEMEENGARCRDEVHEIVFGQPPQDDA